MIQRRRYSPFSTARGIPPESVTGSMLSINGYPEATTPFLESLHEGFLNLGIAESDHLPVRTERKLSNLVSCPRCSRTRV